MIKSIGLIHGLIALGLAACISNAMADQITESRDVSGFSAISFAGSGDLYLTQGDEESLSVEADDDVMSSIVTEVKDGVLHLYRKKTSSWRGWFDDDDVRYDLTFVTLDSLRIAGSGDAFAGRIEGADFAINISGSADVNIDELDVDSLQIAVTGSGELRVAELNAGELKSRITGSGEVQVSGAVNSQQISVTGSGDHIAPMLQSESVAARVAGSGTVDVWVTGDLEANVSGSGDVIYRGDPSVNSRVSGSGDVSQRGEHM